MAVDVNAPRTAALCLAPPPTALVEVQPPSAPTVFARPVTALGVMASIGVGLYAGTLLLSIGLIAAVMAIACLPAVRVVLRRGLQGHAERRARYERRRSRERRLDEAGVAREGLSELVVLGDEIEKRDPKLAHRYDVDDLLDRHV